MEIASAFDHRLKGPADLKILYTMYYMYYIVMMFSRRVNEYSVSGAPRVQCVRHIIQFSSVYDVFMCTVSLHCYDKFDKRPKGAGWLVAGSIKHEKNVTYYVNSVS